tara:strand:- start:366 stop:515 length:150 start_codon:yes stop_codon:yes gene_type:complete
MVKIYEVMIFIAGDLKFFINFHDLTLKKELPEKHGILRLYLRVIYKVML